MADRHLAATGEGLGAQAVVRVQDFLDVPVKYLARLVAEQLFSCCVPGTDRPVLGDRIRSVRRVLQQREQFRFQHRPLASVPLGS